MKVKKIHTVPLIVVVVLIFVVFASHSNRLLGVVWPEPEFSMSPTYIDAVGPLKAQQVALELSKSAAGFPNGHVFEHGVGAYLYKKYGVRGVAFCKNYLEFGCYHGFMLELPTLDEVEAGLSYCATLSPNNLLGCFHGAGHVALSTLSEYNVPQALEFCSVFAQTYAASSSIDTVTTMCAFGVFMDNALPGVMEGMTRALFSTSTSLSGADTGSMSVAHQSNQVIGNAYWKAKNTDLSFPCNDSTIKQQYRAGCWEMRAIEIEHTLSMTKSVALCNAILNDTQKYYCFQGLAAGYRWPLDSSIAMLDIRLACDVADARQWKYTCLVAFLRFAYFNGVSERIPVPLCPLIDSYNKEKCKDIEFSTQQAIAK